MVKNKEMSTLCEGSSKNGKCKRKNALGNRSDIGWLHGIDVDKNSRKVNCKYCEKVFIGGIYHFNYHLAATQKDVEPCLIVIEYVKKQMMHALIRSVQISEKKKKEIFDIDHHDLSNEVKKPKKWAMVKMSWELL